MAAFVNENSFILNQLKKVDLLAPEEEYQLATKWQANQDPKAMDRILKAHLKLVAKIANGYRGYGLPLNDLMAEGSLGMVQALKNYNPENGARFSTYAMWWIKAQMQDYILKTWSMVKLGTTNAQKKLFFSLRKQKEILRDETNNDDLTAEKVSKIATTLKVSEHEVWDMDQRLRGKDASLQTPIGNDSEQQSEWQDFLEDDSENQEVIAATAQENKQRNKALSLAMASLNDREREIIIGRRLSDPPLTLEDISKTLKLSRERVRQLEVIAFEKLQKNLTIMLANK